MSHETWDKVEERRKMKEKVNNARIRAQKQEAQNKHQFLNKEVKKCAGIDEIPPEAFKSGGNEIIEYMYKLLNKIWLEEKIPKEWLKVASEILCKTILSRNKDAIDQVLRDEQAGFRSNRSCTDQIAKLRTIIEQSVEWQSSLYINFVDFERAFDSVNREGMWQLLRHYDIPTKIVNMIKALYEDFTVQVIHESSFTNPFHVDTGVKQGCLLSPTLFLIAIDWVTKQALETTPRGIQWNFAQRLEDLDFADDLALLSHLLKDIRDKTTKLHETGKKLGLKINIKKTKIMRVKTRKGGTVSIEGEDIEEVDQFTYLGSIMDRTDGTDIRTRIKKPVICQANQSSVRKTSRLSGKLVICEANQSSVRQTSQLSGKLVICQANQSSVRQISHLSGKLVICQANQSSVRQTSHLSGKLVICQENQSSVRKTSHLSGKPVICQANQSSNTTNKREITDFLLCGEFIPQTFHR
ncbi:unnamed protein product [Mytilus coruscus]|uniref:Reverse transcriptase domain-containing protein n=1 Tax=Mytilus coruscus TaxID=42192 RepID=A0A6J8AWR3_MYTCO|nr:unnamed protein product [Mytilus coruscus]